MFPSEFHGTQESNVSFPIDNIVWIFYDGAAERDILVINKHLDVNDRTARLDKSDLCGVDVVQIIYSVASGQEVCLGDPKGRCNSNMVFKLDE